MKRFAFVRALCLICVCAVLISFADTWQQTTTDEFSTAGSSASNTQVINDSVQIAKQSDWWDPATDWPTAMSAYQYKRPVTVSNNSGSTLTDYQVLLEPFRDSCDFTGDNLDNTGLTGAWDFSEGQGQTAQDSSGNGNNGQLGSTSGVDANDPAWTMGRYGNGLVFDGPANDYVNLGNINLTNKSFTLEAWAKRRVTGVFHLIIGQGTASAENGLHFGFRNDNTFTLDFYADPLSTAAYTDTDWHHWVATYDSSSRARRIYRDGILVANNTASANYQGSGNMNIGRRLFDDGGGYLYFNGLIDEVKVYTRPLTAEEVSMRYGAGLAGSWHFSEGSGQSTVDMSGCNNSAQLGATSGVDTSDPAWGTGRFGAALSFDGSDDYAVATDSDSLSFANGAFSMDFWFKAPVQIGPGDDRRYMVVKGTGGNYEYGINISLSTGKVQFETWTAVGGSAGFVTSTLSYTNDIWHHIVAVREGNNTSTDRIRLYIDGQLSTNTITVTNSITNTSSNLVFGNRMDLTSWYKGLLDEVRFYNRALSPAEVQFRYNAGAPKYKHDFSDIRFVSNDGTQVYNYWQETDRRFWVKIPSIAASDSIIKMYYGNSSAAGMSSWSNTFASAGTYAQESSVDINTKRLWHMNENGGGTTADVSGNNDTGSLTGCTWTTGQFGSGIQFNGTGDYININFVRNSFVNAITVDAWINPASDNTQRLIFSKNGPVIFYIDTNNKLYGGIYSVPGVWVWVSGKTALSAGVWQHVAMSYNGNYLGFYINGVLDAYGAGPGAINSVDGPDYIGKDEWLTSNFKGVMDEMRISDIALDSSAIMKSAGVRKNSAIEPTHLAPGDEIFNGAWQYRRAVAIANNSGSTLTDYQTLVEPFRDTGDFRGDNLNNTGLIGSWSLDEGAGANTADASGNSNDGTLTSCSWISGRFNNAVQFDGTNSKIVKTNPAGFPTGASAFTIEAWFTTNDISNYRRFIWYGDGGANDAGFGVSNTGRLTFVEDIITEYTDNTTSLSAGRWYYAAATYDGSNLRLWLNGINIRTWTGVTLNISSSTQLRIGGGKITGETEKWNGIIDEVKIYNRALSSNEISMRYGSGLVGSWHFSDGAGQSSADTSGKGGNGQLGSGAGNDVSDPAWTASGKSGNALSFDGSDDYISVSDNTNFSFTNLTIEAWIKTSNQTVYKFIMQKYNTASPNQGFALAMNVTASNQLGMWVGGSAWTYGNFTWDGGWHHLVGIYDGTTVYLYVDGTQIGTPQAQSANLNYSVPLYIGTYAGTTGTYNFLGQIDEVRIYNRALSATEVSARYASDSPKYRYDFADIRFASSDGAQAYNFWQETDTRFWVKVPSLAAGASSLQMYYGNASAPPAANGSKTFSFFDDFNDGDMSDWTTSGGAWSVDTPDYSMKQTTTSPEYQAGKYFYNADCILESDAMILNAGADPNVWLMFRKSSPTASYGATNLSAGLSGWNSQYSIYNGSSNIVIGSGASLSANVWYKLKTTMSGTNIVLYVNNAQVLSNGSAAVSSGNYLGVRTNVTGAKYDNIRVRKYASVEPVNTLGSEQLPYQPSGAFTSSIKDTGIDNTVINSIAWTPSGTGTITMEIRADNSDPAGWTEGMWADVTSNPETLSGITGRYVQYRATFAGSGLSSDPVLADVTVTYTTAIVPPADSVSCDKLADTWYSTAVFTFTNDTGFGADIEKYYYAWDNAATYTFTLGEPVWDSSTPQLQNSSTSDGTWYFHYLPYSSTDTPGTAQDLGPFEYDATVPDAAVLTLPANDGSVSVSTPSFEWEPVTDLSGVSYILQVDYYTSFTSPVINRTGLLTETYTLTGAGAENLLGSTVYYWRVIAADGADNSVNSNYMKFTTTPVIPKITNTMTGESYSTVQDAIDSGSTVDGDIISVQDTVAHDENITITKDITLENAILAPASGFAVTGQGASGSEVLRNCVIISGGVSDLALGENLTIYNPDPTAVATVQNSKLVNCLIESGTIITNSDLENCYIETTAGYFVDAANNDFHLASAAANAIDAGKNLGAEFTDDMDEAERGTDILDIANFDTGAWDIGAYEFEITGGYINPPEAPSVPEAYFPADGTEDLGTDIVLIWNPSTGSTPITYSVQVLASVDMTNPYYTAADISDTFAEVDGLSYDTTYYWQVKASNDVGESGWSGVYDFTTQAGTIAPPPPPEDILQEAPSVPELSYPGDNAEISNGSVILVWYPSATGTAPVTYSLELALAEDMTLVLYAYDDIEDTFQQIDGLPYNTPYYWRVKAVNGAGESVWSSVFEFIVKLESTGTTGVLSAPSLSSPANNAALAGSLLTFQWNLSSGTGSAAYDFQASASIDFTALAMEYTNITGGELVVSSGFSYGTTYYWRVRAHDENGYSGWSGIRAFTRTQGDYSTDTPATGGYTAAAPSQETIRQKGGCFIKMLR